MEESFFSSYGEKEKKEVMQFLKSIGRRKFCEKDGFCEEDRISKQEKTALQGGKLTLTSLKG